MEYIRDIFIAIADICLLKQLKYDRTSFKINCFTEDTARYFIKKYNSHVKIKFRRCRMSVFKKKSLRDS